MLKQPKYFMTSRGITRMHSSGVSIPSTPTSSELRIPKQTGLSSIRTFTHMPTAILGIGLSTLVALSLMVGVNTGYIKWTAFRGNLPILFSKSSSNQTVIAQSGGFAGGINFDIKTADARIEIVRAFLERYKSPLTPHEHYASALVEASDRYGLDYRLLPAIMMQESNLCKNSDPKIHNCLGFGIHERGTLGFDSYEESFDRAARELKANYIDRGLTTPEQIMKKYTPSSNGSWANSVNQWIAEMEHNDREAGKTATGDANLLEYTAQK